MGVFGIDKVHAVPPAMGQGSTCHPKTSSGVSTLCCRAGVAEKGVVKTGLFWQRAWLLAWPWWVSTPLWLRIYLRWRNSGLQQDILVCSPGWVTVLHMA